MKWVNEWIEWVCVYEWDQNGSSQLNYELFVVSSILCAWPKEPNVRKNELMSRDSHNWYQYINSIGCPVLLHCNRAPSRTKPNETHGNTTWIVPTESNKYENRIEEMKEKIKQTILSKHSIPLFSALFLRISWNIPCICVHIRIRLVAATKFQCKGKISWPTVSVCLVLNGKVCITGATNYQSREFRRAFFQKNKNLLYKNGFVPFLLVFHDLSAYFRRFIKFCFLTQHSAAHEQANSWTMSCVAVVWQTYKRLCCCYCYCYCYCSLFVTNASALLHNMCACS